MKLSERTVSLLKNFGNIYPGMLFRPGNVIATCTKARNFIARAKVEETFEQQFGIFDVKRFLACVSLFEQPELTFETSHVLISDGKRKLKYYYAEPTTFDYPPNKEPL